MATIASIDTAVRANTSHFQKGMRIASKELYFFKKAQEQAARSAETMAKSILREIDVLKFGENQVRLNELALSGVDLKTRDHIRTLIAHREALEADAEAMREIQSSTDEYFGASQTRGTNQIVSDDVLKNLKTFGSILKGGGAIVGLKLISQQVGNAGESFEQFAIKVRNGEATANGFFEDLVSHIPIFGDLLSGASAAARGVGELASAYQKFMNPAPSLRSLSGGPSSFAAGLDIRNTIAEINKTVDDSRLGDLERQLWAVSEPIEKMRQSLADAATKLKKDDVVAWSRLADEIEKADNRLKGLLGERQADVKEQDRVAKEQAIIAERIRKQREEASGFLSGPQDMIRFVEQQAKEAAAVQEAIAKQAELGIQKSVEAQEMANERMARDFVAKRIKANSVETPLFAETATFGSRAAFEARQRLIRGDTKDDQAVTAKKILDEAKKQNQNLEKVIEALREQFPEANL